MNNKDISVRDNNINTMRFLGAFMVLWGHTFELCFGPGGGHGPFSDSLRSVAAYNAGLPGIGVAMFFILSGYLVTKSYLHRNNVLTYVESRVLRIFPALWVALLFTVLIIGPLVTKLDLQAYFSGRGTWNYLLYNARLFPDVMYRLPGVFMENPRAGGVNGSLWTLPVELRMYAIVAVLGLMGVLRERALFNIVAVILVMFFIVAPDSFFLLHKPQHERLGLYFLLGAAFYVNADLIRLRFAGVAGLGLLVYLNFQNTAYNLVFSLWFSYLTLYLAFHPRLRLPDLSKYGDFSYGLYLYAFPLTQLAIFWWGPENPWFIMSVTFAGAMIMAIASWFLIERPAMRLKGLLSRE